jgi:hypothetical protein
MPRDVMGVYKPTKEDKERERRYRAEDDFRTLSHAAEIHADKDRVAAVKEMHAEHAEMLAKIFGEDGMGKKEAKSGAKEQTEKQAD